MVMPYHLHMPSYFLETFTEYLWLDEAQWGKGYMSEAVCAVLDYGFNKLGLTLISANCYPQNKRSQRVLEKMGFTYEGILHQAEVSYDDKIYDHLCYYLEKNNLK